MSNWTISANLLGGDPTLEEPNGELFFIQQDSDWMSRPSIATMTAIAAPWSTFQWANSPSKTRTLSGYMVSAYAYKCVTTIAQAGELTTLTIGEIDKWGVYALTTYNVYILSIKGNLVMAYNLPYLNMVTVDIVDASVG